MKRMLDDVSDEDLLDGIRTGSVLLTLDALPLSSGYRYLTRLAIMCREARERNLIGWSW